MTLSPFRDLRNRGNAYSAPPSSLDVLGGRYPKVYDPNAPQGNTPNVFGVIYTGLGYCLDIVKHLIPPPGNAGPVSEPAPAPIFP